MHVSNRFPAKSSSSGSSYGTQASDYLVSYTTDSCSTLALELLPERELELSHAHVVFTNRLFGTRDESDGRYHMSVSVYGFPSLISTTGIVEAPAKPKEFYELKQRYAALGLPVPMEGLKEKLRQVHRLR
jgi:hypothetical protein